jgi:hypothetical protein
VPFGVRQLTAAFLQARSLTATETSASKLADWIVEAQPARKQARGG